MVAAKPSSNVAAFNGRQKSTVRPAITTAAPAMRNSSGGKPASAAGSSNEAQFVASSQIRLSRLPKSACSTSRWTLEVSDCSSNKTPAAKRVVKTTPIAAPASMRPSLRIASIIRTAMMAATAAPRSIGQVLTLPVTRKPTTMPGRTTWLIASPINACRRKIRKLPGMAQVTAARMPISSGVRERTTNSFIGPLSGQAIAHQGPQSDQRSGRHQSG